MVTHDALVKFKEAAFLTPTGAAAASPSSWRLILQTKSCGFERIGPPAAAILMGKPWETMGKRGKVINV